MAAVFPGSSQRYSLLAHVPFTSYKAVPFVAHSHLCLPPSSIFGWISNLIHEHTISQNNLFNEPLVLTAVFKTGHGNHKKSMGNCPFWIETLTPALHSVPPKAAIFF